MKRNVSLVLGIIVGLVVVISSLPQVLRVVGFNGPVRVQHPNVRKIARQINEGCLQFFANGGVQSTVNGSHVKDKCL